MDPSKNEKEQLLSLYFQEGVDPESYNQSYKLRQQLSSSKEGVAWFLQNYPFELPTTYISAFECFKYRLSYFSEEFSVENLEELKGFLFDKCSEFAPNLPPNAIFELCNAQTYLSILIFPNYVPDLFTSIFNYPDIIKFRFLAAFCEYIVLPTPKNVDRINTIKSFFVENKFQEQILSQIQLGIQQKIPDSINALASFDRWADISFLANEELINVIFSDTSAENAIPVLKLIGSIARRGMPDALKENLINAMHIFSHIEFYCQNYSDNFDIILACAELVSIVGYSLSNPIPELYNLLSIFLDQPDAISEKVIGCFRTFVRNNPNSADEVSMKVVSRMISYFAANPLSTFGRYLQELFFLLKECFDQKQESFYNAYEQLLNNIRESGTSPDLTQLSAFLAITNFMFTSKIQFIGTLKDDYFSLTRTLLNIQPPIDDQLFFPIFSFLRIFIYREEDQISKDYNKDVLQQLTLFSLNGNIREEIRKNFENLLYRYVMKKYKYCPAIASQIEQFLNAKTKEFMQISGLILGSLMGKPKVEATGKCFQFITEGLLSEGSYEGLSLSLSFLCAYKPGDDNDKRIVFDILSKIFEECTKVDELLGNFCLSIKGLNEHGFEIFNAALPHVNGVFSITAAADVCLFYYKLFQKYENEEGVQAIYRISNTLINMFVDITTELLSMPLKADEVHQILSMINNCYNLSVKCYSSINEDQNLLNKLLGFTRDLLISKYDHPQVLQLALRFLSEASSKNPQLYATEFVGLSMYFILAPSFDPDKREWVNLFMDLLNFHSKLNKGAYQQFTDALSKIMNSFGLQQFLESYLLSLEKDQRLMFYSVKQIFVKILVVRNSMTW